MSKNVPFAITETNGQKILTSGEASRALPSKQAWHMKIYRDFEGVPFVSDGKTSVRCIRFFQTAGNSSAEAAVPPPPPRARPTTMLPGMKLKTGAPLTVQAIRTAPVFQF